MLTAAAAALAGGAASPPPLPGFLETLAGYGARPWQAGLTAEPLARAFASAAAGYSGVADNGTGSAGDHAASGELT